MRFGEAQQLPAAGRRVVLLALLLANQLSSSRSLSAGAQQQLMIEGQPGAARILEASALPLRADGDLRLMICYMPPSMRQLASTQKQPSASPEHAPIQTV